MSDQLGGQHLTAGQLVQNAVLVASGSKRKLDDELMDDQLMMGNDDSGQPRDKRLRTTILPEQLDYLYQQYQLESNPSRKMLETISREVGLKKRVVQVWFQNTRARERKGQFRAHAQVINKRCPFCPALFKVKSALESHLSTRHPDAWAKGTINIDALPDEVVQDITSDIHHLGANANHDAAGAANPNTGSTSNSTSASPTTTSHTAAAVAAADLKRLTGYQSSMASMASLSMLSSLYQQGFAAPANAEDALKRYASEYLAAAATTATAAAAAAPTETTPPTTTKAGTTGTGELPLDLSKPLPLLGHQQQQQQQQHLIRPESAMHSEAGTDFDSRSEHYMDYFMEGGDDCSNPSSPLPFSSGSKAGHNNSSMAGSSCGGGGGGGGGQGKRFRTQMSAVQVRVMKSLFNDYKTPTMAECEALGREIGLPKRVVQVWFQNARAKEKKYRMNLQKSLSGPGGSDDAASANSKQPEGCTLCEFKYSHKYAVQDHIFTHQHIERVKAHVAEQSGNYIHHLTPSFQKLRKYKFIFQKKNKLN